MTLYAITFLCLGQMACSMTPEMSRYDGRMVFESLESCKSAAMSIQVSAGAARGCVDQNHVIVWTYEWRK